MRNNRKPKLNKGLVSFSWYTAIMVCCVVLLGHGVELIAYASALVIHEYFHVVVSERLGYGIDRIRVMPYGISIDGKYEYLKPKHEAYIALAGPLANLVVWFLLIGIWWLFPAVYAYTQLIAYANLFTALLNLLPVFPMDGGRILKGLLLSFLSRKRADNLIVGIGILFGVASVAVCLTLIILGANYSYATIAIFILASAITYRSDAKYERVYSMAYSLKRLKHGLPVRELLIDQNITLTEMFKMLKTEYYTRFIVCDEDMKTVAELTERDLEKLLAKYNGTDTIISVAFSAEKKYNGFGK